ncbi:MAG: NAD-dependent epimerase/dehydratase family protein [Thermoleophilaceae bacterium]|nr:NAD-dependent epimerase/dehydratase family protein [Thermoleophilaceae bacterium]
MTGSGTPPTTIPGSDARSNGLPEAAPNPGQRVLVAGGGGYIGCILTRCLLDRGYRVRVLDRLYWGEEVLGHVIDEIELVQADVRDFPGSALEDVDAVINLSGLSNDPTAEYSPEANWQMNAVATENMADACVARGIDRFVFASSCSLYDGLPAGMHDEPPQSSRAAPTPPPSTTASSTCSRWRAIPSARCRCATAPCTAGRRACATTSW